MYISAYKVHSLEILESDRLMLSHTNDVKFPVWRCLEVTLQVNYYNALSLFSEFTGSKINSQLE